MRPPIVRLALVGTVIAAFALSALPVASAAQAPAKPDQQPSRPGWRTIAVLRHCGKGDGLETLAVDAKSDAWALGQPNTGGARCGADVEHWNGSTWRRIAVPPNVGLGLELTFPLAASSATDAWIFPEHITFAPVLNASFDTALHWNGKSWHGSKFPVRLLVNSALSFGRTNAWAFGGYFVREDVIKPYFARFNGHAWHKATTPGDAQSVSATSASDIWAAGPSLATVGKPVAKQRTFAWHWNGHTWHGLRVPTTNLPKGGRAGDELPINLVAAGPRQLWLSYQGSVNRPNNGLVLLQLSHSRWQRITLPRSIFELDNLASDGHGGIWLLGLAGNQFLDTQYWFHYSAGRWTSQRVPSPKGYNLTLFDLAPIPGTTSDLAVGEADKNTGNRSEAVIDRYLP